MLPHASLSSIINEEIGLEGLEGSTLETLWNHIAIRLRMAMPLPQKLMDSIWQQILRNPEYEFYLLLAERKPFVHFDRLGKVDPENGVAMLPSEYPGHRFAYRPIEANGIRGSCEEYDTRTSIPRQELSTISSAEAENRYGRKFVIVASQRIRESFLIDVNCTAELPVIQYCMLERIGRSRYNGETSHGKYSLIEVAGDSSSMFYHRKALSSAKLITRQNLSVRIDDVSIQGMVLHLPRYYNEMKTKNLIIAERVMNELKKRKFHMADYDEIKMMMLHKTDAGKLFRSPEFQRYIKTDETVPYRTLYPDASQSAWMSKRGEEKLIRVMRLVDPAADVYDAWNRDAQEEAATEAKEGFLCGADSSSLYVDIPLLQLAYNVIAHHGGSGISQSELATTLGLDRLNARAVVKNLNKLKAVESMSVDEGRQRTAKFFIPGFSQRSAVFEKEMSQYVANQLNVIKGKQKPCSSSVVEPPGGEPSRSVVDPSCSEDKKPLVSDLEDSMLSTETDPEAQMVAFDSTVHDNIITDVIMSDKLHMKKAPKGISNAMKSKTVSEQMLRRCNFIIDLVKQEDAIEPRTILKRLKLEESQSGSRHQVCNKSVMRLVGRLAADKLVLIANVTMKREEREFHFVFVCDPTITADHAGLQSKLSMAKARIVLLARASVGGPQAVPHSSAEPRGYPGSLAKCLRMRLLHEFLFYLVYVRQGDGRDLPVSDLATIDLAGLDASDLPAVYSDTNDWKMFVPPLNAYDGYGPGWIMLTDVFVRMPLRVFCAICTFSFYTPDLDYYLEHPVRQYLLLKHLPEAIRAQLLTKRRYVQAVLETTKLLCYSGLLQMGPQLRKTRDQTFVYVNQRACLLDTTESREGYNEIEPRKYPMVRFQLATMEDVCLYWETLHDVATGTRLNIRNTAIGREVLVQQLHGKPVMADALRVQSAETAPLNDRTDRLPPGDGKGAAGFDSAMYMHLKCNWQKSFNQVPTIVKHRAKVVSRTAKLKGRATSAKAGGYKSVPVKKTKPSRSRIKKRVIVPRKLTRRLWREGYDDVDLNALKLMNKLRVKWSRSEDRILVVCRVAIHYLYGPLQSISCPVNSSTIRDVLHWANPRSACKTSRACQRRVLYMKKKLPAMAELVRTCLEETKLNATVNERYGPGFVARLRQRFPDLQQYMVASRIHFVQLVQLLRQVCAKLLRGTDGPAAGKGPRKGPRMPDAPFPRLPGTLDELYRSYAVTETTGTEKLLNYAADPATLQELQLYKLTVLMHGAVTGGRPGTPEPLQRVYREFPDSVLAGAMRLVRSFHLVSANKRLKGVGTKLLVTNTALVGDRELYHVSIHYQQQLITSLSFDMFAPLFGHYVQLLDRARYDEMVTCDDAKGRVILLSELLTAGRIEMDIEQATDYIEMKADAKETVPYDAAMLSALPGSREDVEEPGPSGKSKLRFSLQKDVTFLYVVHPVEQLSKLPIEYFHIFCLLEQLQAADRRLTVQTFQIDEAHPSSCTLPHCVVGTGGGSLVARCLASVRDRSEQLARIRQHGVERSQRKHRFDPGMIFDVREDNLLVFFGKYVHEFQGRWSGQHKRDVNRQSQKAQALTRTTVNVVELIEECLRFDEASPEYSWLDRYEQTNVLEDDDAAEGDERSGDLMRALSEKVFKLHNFYEVMSLKVHVRMKATPGDWQQDREPYGPWSIPRRFLPDGAKRRREILMKLRSDAIWPLLSQLGPHTTEAKRLIERNSHAAALLTYIENKKKLGATVGELAVAFPNHAQIRQHLHTLCSFKLLLRTGFRSVTYVYWQYVGEWMTKVPVPEPRQSADRVPSEQRDDLPAGSKRKGPAEEGEHSRSGKKPKRESGVSDGTCHPNGKNDKTANTSGQGSSEKPNETDTQMLLALAPWNKIDGNINKRLVFRWLTAILLYCAAHPGVPLSVLFVRFNMMPPFHLRQLLELLQEYGCVSLHSMECLAKKTIFSVFKPATIVPGTELVPDEHTYVETAPDALGTLSLCIGEYKKYVQDFYNASRQHV